MNHTIFITTYKKYAEGDGGGIFVTLEKFKDFEPLMQSILDFHADEPAPELMCTDPAGLPGFPESCTRESLRFFFEVCKDNNADLYLAYLELNPEAPANWNYIEFCDNVNEALAGDLSEVNWTNYPDFKDWAFLKFLQAHPELSEWEDYLDVDRIEREYNLEYDLKNNWIFRRHA